MTATIQSDVEAPVRGLTFAELHQRFGDMPPHRIRLQPYPATEQDVIEIDAHEDRLCELVDGILVEKAMGWQEGNIAMVLGHLLQSFLTKNDLGIVAGEGGMMKLWPGRVRIPDVSFVSLSQFPGGKIGRTPIPSIYPDLAVEVLSESNTRKEMKDKRSDYFKAGTRLVWIVDPETRTVEVYAAENPKAPTTFKEIDTVVGDPVLPGFSFTVATLFEKLANE